MIYRLPDELIENVVIHIENIDDVRRFFAVNLKCHSFASKRRLSLMWVEKNTGVHHAFKHAVLLGDDAFAHELIAKMNIGQKRISMVFALDKGFAGPWITALMVDAALINCRIIFPNGQAARLLHLVRTADAARVLLAVPGIDVNLLDTNGMTALHVATRFGYDDVVAVLLAAPGISINMQINNNIGMTALHIAAGKGRHSIIQMLLAASGIVVNALDSNNNTALHVAAVASPDSAPVLLADPRVAVNHQNRQGHTALHLVAKFGSVEMTKAIMATPGADITLRNVPGNTPLHIAVLMKQYAVVAQLLSVAPDAIVNIPGEGGATPLHVAAMNGDVALTASIVVCCPFVEVNARDHLGATPLHHAVKLNNIGVMAALLVHDGINIHIKDDRQREPLYYAAGSPVAFKMLATHRV